MLNYFELFGLPVSFTPPKDVVRKTYVELSKKNHPDYFAQADETKQAKALELSAEINKAYKVFNNKQATIEYVLKLKGVLAEEEKYNLSPDFLMEMMEINEQVAESSFDLEPEAKQRIQQQVSAVENDIYKPVEKIIENYIDGETTTKELVQVKDYYFKKKYLTRIYEALQGML